MSALQNFAIASKDIHAEYKRLEARGVKFPGGPKQFGPVTAVLFEDTCGNLINLFNRPDAALPQTHAI